MAIYLQNIGDSLSIRSQISQTDIHNSTISLILDQPRTLEVVTKSSGRTELAVRCRDIEERTTVVLHLPYKEGAAASATIINHTKSNEESPGA